MLPTSFFYGDHVHDDFDYRITPEFVLSNPNATTIAMAEVTVTFDDGRAAIYGAHTFTIPVPLLPTWYYVTVDISTRVATCQTSHDLAGAAGHIYIGAIKAIPAWGSLNALAGGWPAPQTYIVGD
jgi:hypothetical protein